MGDKAQKLDPFFNEGKEIPNICPFGLLNNFENINTTSISLFKKVMFCPQMNLYILVGLGECMCNLD